MARKVRCILSFNKRSPLIELFSSLNGKELKKFRLAGFSKEEILSYQERGIRLYKKVTKLKGISFMQGEAILGNELLGLGETTYKLVREQIKNPEADLLYIEKMRVLETFSSQ